jgi:hypothetical protein
MLQLSYANDIFGLREFALMPRHELCRWQLDLCLLLVFHFYLSDTVKVRCTWEPETVLNTEHGLICTQWESEEILVAEG